MGKVVKTVIKVAAVVAAVAAAIPSGGTSLLALGLGVSATAAAAIAVGLSVTSSLLSGRGKAIPQSETQLGRLQARLDTQAPRKIVLGKTAMPADIRYYEGSGTDEEYVDYIVCVAAHRVGSIDEIWFEDTLAWKSAGGVQGDFVGYLTTVTTRLEGTAANTVAINGGTRWGTDDRLTGCAYVHLRIKRSGNSDNEQSPLASGLPGRVTIIGEGMPEYDPRFDSTVGGSGTQRVDDQDTWGPSSGNTIIQSLNVLLGWRINGKLSVGGGIPVKYLDLDSAITAANICDEDIALAGGGTQPRYRTAGAFSTNDAPLNIVGALLAGCAGDLLDSEGKLSFLIKTNTLATPAVTFDDHDLLSKGVWDPMGGATDLPNIISGTFTDPSNNSLYQPVPYPSVSLPSEDGIERTEPLDLGVIENSARAERVVKQTLQRKQYPGTFTGEYNMKGLAAKVGSIVWQTYSPRGWVNKPFRVVKQKPSRSGRIALVLREENAAIYAWEAEDSASVQPAVAVGFDPKNSGPILLARQASKTADWSKVVDDDGGKPADNADVTGENTAAAIVGQGSGATANDLSGLNAAEGQKLGGISPKATSGNNRIPDPVNLPNAILTNVTAQSEGGIKFFRSGGGAAAIEVNDLPIDSAKYLFERMRVRIAAGQSCRLRFYPRLFNAAGDTLYNNPVYDTTLAGTGAWQSVESIFDMSALTGAASMNFAVSIVGPDPIDMRAFYAANVSPDADNTDQNPKVAATDKGASASDNLVRNAALLEGAGNLILTNMQVLVDATNGPHLSVIDTSQTASVEFRSGDATNSYMALQAVGKLFASMEVLTNASLRMRMLIRGFSSSGGAAGPNATVIDRTLDSGSAWVDPVFYVGLPAATWTPSRADIDRFSFVLQMIGGAAGKIAKFRAPRLAPTENRSTLGTTFGVDAKESAGGPVASLTNFKTQLGTSASVLGQTAWATFTGDSPTVYSQRVAYLDTSGKLSALDKVVNRRLTLLTRADGSTALTEADTITPLGTAAAIAGQGSGATANNLSQLNAAEGTKFAGIETTADVTKTVSGPTQLTLNYASDGTLTTALPLEALFKLTPAGGASYTAGVTWAVEIVAGSFAGAAPTIAGGGSGQLSINSGLAVDEALLNVTATYGGKAYPPFPVKVTQSTAAASNTGGGGGGESFGNDTTLSNFSTTTFAAISDEITITTPSGSTSAALNASNISLRPLGTANGSSGVEMKWQRWNGSAWVDVGATATAFPVPEISTDPEGFSIRSNGSITCNRTSTGLTASTSYKFRLVARISSGVTRTIDIVGGEASAQG